MCTTLVGLHVGHTACLFCRVCEGRQSFKITRLQDDYKKIAGSHSRLQEDYKKIAGSHSRLQEDYKKIAGSHSRL
jgi:predicted nuclease with TOPRIM domain